MRPVECYLVGENEPRVVRTLAEFDHLLDVAARGSNEEFGHTLECYADDDNNRLVVGSSR